MQGLGVDTDANILNIKLRGLLMYLALIKKLIAFFQQLQQPLQPLQQPPQLQQRPLQQPQVRNSIILTNVDIDTNILT